jgi:hypothetical protein
MWSLCKLINQVWAAHYKAHIMKFSAADYMYTYIHTDPFSEHSSVCFLSLILPKETHS